ncbi:uncharacterized protein [Nicotiana sylvestris]|uniref:uncharacterized protein n=1 Tax=Nicotiana sylvestris TaxID=4096 RepID=UPI00388C8D55
MKHKDNDLEDLEDDIIYAEIVKEVENFENKPKSNLEETEAVNLGNFETVKETRISIHLPPLEKEEYISCFIAQSMMICESIFKMLRKDATTSWNEECQKVFDKIKEYLSKPSVLVPPELGRPLLFYLSVLDGSFGYVLGQHDETGRKISNQEKAVKGQVLADHLVENQVDGKYELLKTYFPDEEMSFIGEDITKAYDGWRMFFNGATNFKGVLGEWATKNTKILPYLHCVQELIKRFTKIEFIHVSRIQNEFVDTLATLYSMIQHPDKNFIEPIPIGIHKQPTYCAYVEEEFDENPWFRDIKEYLERGEYPENATHT